MTKTDLRWLGAAAVVAAVAIGYARHAQGIAPCNQTSQIVGAWGIVMLFVAAGK